MSYDQKKIIEKSFRNFNSGKLYDNSIQLFRALNYPIPIQSPLDDPTWNGLKGTYLQGRPFNEKLALTADWKYFNILFQLTDDAMRNMLSMFSSGRVDNAIINSFLFLVIELKEEHYTKTELSQITREINKIFAMPSIILFKTGEYLTLSVIHRRIHMRDESKDVLKKVTLIKDISIASPHRAHIEILFDLSFEELRRKHGFTNFVELHQAWQKTLDIKELNKRFFRELFNWYLWAVRNVRFPNKVNDDNDDMQFNQEAVIRLLTRLIFIWFIKEKNLVPDKLFDPRFLLSFLKNFNPLAKDSAEYYRAILQNLFFATLNTPMDRDITDANRDEKRGFIDPVMRGGKPSPFYTDQTRYRYKEYFINEQEALKLFSDIPFLNGGLFECLDYAPEDGKDEIRIDGFSTKAHKQAFVPNALFFADEFNFDLNAEYDTKGKQYKVKGLINIFNGYKFTITENTPLEEEVALDPELLGKVFENLLATYNPETRTTARKQTGSFYTPREIVNYMVDESLIAYLSNILDAEDRIRTLFCAIEPFHDFNAEESRKLIHALSHCRILDPACGSGAFPMGILHRMVDLLNKLDPYNEYWKEIQKERAIQETGEAYDIGDNDERKQRLEEINKAFDDRINNPDYARKLFLIENCIYGVDIQQIAVQIAKLRFFISLVAEQKVDDSRPNRNILSMPNLETKFVAANTLIALEKPAGQLSLMSMNEAIEKKEKELRKLREKIFFTRRYHDKKKLKQEEKKCREELKNILIDNNMSKSAAGQMAGWNPFDPLASSPYFDIETMFGFEGGFDVVIGNPPYLLIPKNEFIQCYSSQYKFQQGKPDLYRLFIEKSLSLLDNNSIISFITPNSFLTIPSAENLRKHIVQNFIILTIVNYDDSVFESASVNNIVFLFQKNKPKKIDFFKTLDLLKNKEFNTSKYIDINQLKAMENPKFELNIFSDNLKDKILSKIYDSSISIAKVDDISMVLGLQPYHNTLHTDEQISNRFLHSSTRKNKDYFIELGGRSVHKYSISFDIKSYLDYSAELYTKPSFYYFEGERIIIREITSNTLIAGITNEILLFNKSCYIVKSDSKIFPNKFLLLLFNSNLIGFIVKNTGDKSKQNLFPRISMRTLKSLPIKKTNHLLIYKILAEYLILLSFKKDYKLQLFYEMLVNALFYELYFPTEIQSAGCEVLKHLEGLSELMEEWDDAKKLAVIGQVYRELSDPKNPVSIAMEKMMEVEEVRVIEESVQSAKCKVQSSKTEETGENIKDPIANSKEYNDVHASLESQADRQKHMAAETLVKNLEIKKVGPGEKVTLRRLSDNQEFYYHIIPTAIKGRYTGSYKQIHPDSALALTMMGLTQGGKFEYGGVGYEVLNIANK